MKRQVNEVATPVVIPPEKIVQNVSVGNTPKPRRKRVSETQGLKKDLLYKMRNNLQ